MNARVRWHSIHVIVMKTTEICVREGHSLLMPIKYLKAYSKLMLAKRNRVLILHQRSHICSKYSHTLGRVQILYAEKFSQLW